MEEFKAVDTDIWKSVSTKRLRCFSKNIYRSSILQQCITGSADTLKIIHLMELADAVHTPVPIKGLIWLIIV